MHGCSLFNLFPCLTLSLDPNMDSSCGAWGPRAGRADMGGRGGPDHEASSRDACCLPRYLLVRCRGRRPCFARASCAPRFKTWLANGPERRVHRSIQCTTESIILTEIQTRIAVQVGPAHPHLANTVRFFTRRPHRHRTKLQHRSPSKTHVPHAHPRPLRCFTSHPQPPS